MRRRYAEPDYLAAFMMLGVVFAAGFVVGALIAYLFQSAL